MRQYKQDGAPFGSGKIGVHVASWHVATILLLAAIYYSSAKLGFYMAFDAEQVTSVWPPTGIALAALLLLGNRAWPGLMLGAFLANFSTNLSFLTSSAIAAGNTLEAVAAVWMLRHLVGFDPRLSRVKDVAGLIACSAIFSTAISATVGVTSLCLSQSQPWDTYGWLWVTWWLGDATGALIVAPFLLVWSSQPLPAFLPRRAAEAALIFGGLILTSLAVFTEPSLMDNTGRAFIYIIFPFLIVSALRFGQRGCSTITLLASAIAIWATLHNLGPFSAESISLSLVMLQSFMAVVAITGMMLAATFTERSQMEESLRESDRRKDEFLAMLAHELRNPLAPLGNALQALHLAGNDDKKRGEICEVMERQLRQIVRLVDDLLDISRISHGKIELRRSSVALKEIIDHAIEIARPLIEERQHQLQVTLPDQPLRLEADPARLTQVLANLLHNAAKFTLPRGHIWLDASQQDGTVLLKIRDDGIGIPAHTLPKIFNLFEQADHSLEHVHGGLGIGLALARNLVEMHGGTIGATSTGTNQGSEFILRLPLPAQANVAQADALPEHMQVPEVQPSKFPLSKKVPGLQRGILVVDDNQASAQTMSWTLELLGYEAKTAYDGISAIGIAHDFRPALVLLDLGLPGLNGYEICRRMREDPALKHAVIVAQTGWDQPHHRQKARDAGFDHYLVKPVAMPDLQRLLDGLNDKDSGNDNNAQTSPASTIKHMPSTAAL